jgi:hypothetical protein
LEESRDADHGSLLQPLAIKLLLVNMKYILSASSLLLVFQAALSFQNVDILLKRHPSPFLSRSTLKLAKDDGESYQNKVAEFLSNFLPGGSSGTEEDPLAEIDFNAPKLSNKLSLASLAEALDEELYEKEWFVTGKVNPVYFADSFRFKDPDVSLNGIEGRFGKG